MSRFEPRSFARFAAAGLVVGLVLLTGCEKTREAIGLEKQVPDEFAVVTRAPLSIPPEFRLRVPVPGAQRPQEAAPRDKARDILVGRPAGPAPAAGPVAGTPSGRLSAGEMALLKRAGAASPDHSIRQTVDRESSALAEADKSVFDKVVFWREPLPPGQVVDAEREARRLREATALGNPPNKGEVPVIERRERGLLEGLF